jgi:uncharacterized membrane protein
MYSAGGERRNMAQRVESEVEVQRPVSEVYDYWETLENLPHFMRNVEEVRSTGPDSTHWKVKGPFGTSLEFDARTTQKEANSALAWNTMDGELGTSGQVRFEDLGGGATRVSVIMNYSDPPGGKVGERAARVLAGPQVMLDQDLLNLKDILEGRATPEEVQARPAAANAQSGALAFLSSGAGIALLGGLGLVFLLLRRRGGHVEDRKFRFILEF